MRVPEYLTESHVPYETMVHPPVFTAQRRAHLLHIPGKKVMKAVLLATPFGYYLAVLPASHRVDLEAVARCLQIGLEDRDILLVELDDLIVLRDGREQPRRLLTFVLDGKARLPEPARRTPAVPVDDPAFALDSQQVRRGAEVYGGKCLTCHGMDAIAGGAPPDLRASAIPLSLAAFDAVVRKGGLLQRGMPSFAEMSDRDLEAIRHYLRARAREAARP